MKKILALVFIILTTISCGKNHLAKNYQSETFAKQLTATEFVKGSEDIPLVSDLEQIESNNINFDSESGSIAFVDYKSSVALKLVEEFYLKTLPQMGWKLVKNDPNHLKFIREDEKVEIDFIVKSSEKTSDVVRFFLSSTIK